MEENIIMEQNMIVMRDPKSFRFNFDFPKENLKNWRIRSMKLSLS